ncbi:MAG: PpiC-type peptidyl-prolyl cis-trans isomerase [Acidobacteriaceae bacterium]|jgi:peptidyl-prolyl cis-trans isomerase SurA|nr:PpiC-type peptidyl-prolyl cis-trans isomerase [Acidobacteriaceae bacterium]
MRRLLPCFVLAGIVAIPLSGIADSIVEEIIARVNNQIITRTEYQHSKEELKQEAQQQDPANADKIVAERDKDVLRDLIDQQLLLDKGKDLGITADTELIKKLDDMRKEMKLDSMEDLEKAATAQGVSFEDFKQNIRTQIITQQVIGKEVGSRLSINKGDELAFYNEHKADLERPEQVKLSEILVSTEKKPQGATDEAVVAAAQAKANDLLAQIKKGAAFDEIAKKNSDGPTAAQSGDLGLFKRGTLAKQLEDLTFGMKKDEVSDTIRTKQGFVILKVTDHQAAGVPPFKDIEPRVQDALYMQRLQPALREYLKKLREDAFIDIKPGFVDSGASPNETKPIETTAKDATAKELKKKKKKFGVI